MSLFRRFLAAMLFSLLPAAAWAQCTGGLISNCPPASGLQATDLLLGYQNALTPHYRKVTPNDILGAGFAASFSTLSVSGATTAAGPWSFTAGGTAIAITNNASIGGTLGVSGLANLSGGGSLGGTFAGTPTFTGSVTLSGGASLNGLFSGNPTFIGDVTMATTTVPGISTLSVLRGRPQNFTLATLPTPQGPGDLIYVSDCLNGVELPGAGTGCNYVWSGTSWVGHPSPPTLKVGIGSQAVILGQNFSTLGIGALVATATGPITAGNALTVNASGTIIDAGVPPGGGGGGGGTVTNCGASGVSNAIYPAAGTTVGCLAQVNSSVLTRTSGGVLAETATLPSGLAIPSATLSSPTTTGTLTAASITLTAGLTTAASAAGGANFTCTQGVVPTSPANGNEWCTTAGHFGRYNGVTIGPFIDRTMLSASLPIVYNSGTGALTAPTALTSATGGALTASGGVTITNSALSLTEQNATLGGVFFDALTTVVNGTYGPWYLPTTGGHVISFKAYTGGTSSPGFSVTVQANGVNVTGCTSIAVTSANTAAAPLTTTCTSTAVTLGQRLAIVIAAVAGTPFSSLVQIIGTQTPI